jgi:hypothetical protein
MSFLRGINPTKCGLGLTAIFLLVGLGSTSVPTCERYPPVIVAQPYEFENCVTTGARQLPIGVTNNNTGACGTEEFDVTFSSFPAGWSIVSVGEVCSTFELNIVPDRFPTETSWQVLTTITLCCIVSHCGVRWHVHTLGVWHSACVVVAFVVESVWKKELDEVCRL